MRNPALFIAIGATALTLACAGGGAGSDSAMQMNSADDIAAIGTVRDAWAAAWKAGNASGIASFYTPDAVFAPSDTATVSGGDIMGFFTGFFNQLAPGTLEIMSQKVEVVGDMAYDRGTYRFTATPKTGGSPMEGTGRYIVVNRKQADGSWKIAEHIDNLTTAARPMPPGPPGKAK